jgi:hydrogenase maturation factor
MNLMFGEIVEVGHADGVRVGKVRVGGACRQMILELIADAACGDRVLLCDGVAISRVEENQTPELSHVPRHSR